jgi:hypothetical protein
MTLDRRQYPRVAAVADRWDAFWFRPQPAYTLGLVRIACGAFAVAWALALLPDLVPVLGEQGLAPHRPFVTFQWSVFQLWSGDTAVLTGWALLLIAAIAMTVGWHSRLATILVFVLVHSFIQRGGYFFNAGDEILSIVALVLALSSCGMALSLDQRRRTGTFWSAETVAPWAIRFLQVLVSVIYLVTAQAKLAGRTWVEGSAVSFAWRTDGRWALLPAPEWMADNAILVNALTWGTLLVELAIAVLVWNRRLRFWVLGAGVVMHLAIMVNLNVAFFSVAMFVLYIAFVPPDAVRDFPSRVARRRRPAEKAAVP